MGPAPAAREWLKDISTRHLGVCCIVSIGTLAGILWVLRVVSGTSMDLSCLSSTSHGNLIGYGLVKCWINNLELCLQEAMCGEALMHWVFWCLAFDFIGNWYCIYSAFRQYNKPLLAIGMGDPWVAMILSPVLYTVCSVVFYPKVLQCTI